MFSPAVKALILLEVEENGHLKNIVVMSNLPESGIEIEVVRLLPEGPCDGTPEFTGLERYRYVVYGELPPPPSIHSVLLTEPVREVLVHGAASVEDALVRVRASYPTETVDSVFTLDPDEVSDEPFDTLTVEAPLSQ